MSEREYYYASQIEQDISVLINGKSFDYLIDQVVNDELLNNNQKMAVAGSALSALNN